MRRVKKSRLVKFILASSFKILEMLGSKSQLNSKNPTSEKAVKRHGAISEQTLSLGDKIIQDLEVILKMAEQEDVIRERKNLVFCIRERMRIETEAEMFLKKHCPSGNTEEELNRKLQSIKRLSGIALPFLDVLIEKGINLKEVEQLKATIINFSFLNVRVKKKIIEKKEDEVSVCDGNIYIGDQQLTEDGRTKEAVLSPDKKEIAFIRSETYPDQLWIMNADGRSPWKILVKRTRGEPGHIGACYIKGKPVFTSDSREIYFMRQDGYDSLAYGWCLYAVDTFYATGDGMGEEKICDGFIGMYMIRKGLFENCLLISNLFEEQIVWGLYAPDGKRFLTLGKQSEILGRSEMIKMIEKFSFSRKEESKEKVRVGFCRILNAFFRQDSFVKLDLENPDWEKVCRVI